MPTTKEILIAARKDIETADRWYGGARPYNGDSRKCAQLAISHASDDMTARRRAFNAFMLATGIEGGSITNIWDWNDHQSRTHAEVLAAFDKAIASSDHQKDGVPNFDG